MDVMGNIASVILRPSKYYLNSSLASLGFCGFSLNMMVKALQIIDFTGLMAFFNVKYDPFFKDLLKEFSEATEISYFIIPTGPKINTIDNSRASAYKGKITELDQPPYILQKFMYTDIVIIVLYLV